MLRTLLFPAIALALCGGHALAQKIVATGGFPPMQSDVAKHHMGPFGKPCLTIVGYAKPELANKNIYQHLIKAANDCSQNIKIKVCYYKSEVCTLMSVPPWDRKESMLGIFPALKHFQFEVKEQF